MRKIFHEVRGEQEKTEVCMDKAEEAETKQEAVCSVQNTENVDERNEE